MAKKKPADAKPAAVEPEAAFVDLMMVAADFVKNCGGLEQAKKALGDAGAFIKHAGNVAAASKALDVLENLKARI